MKDSGKRARARDILFDSVGRMFVDKRSRTSAQPAHAHAFRSRRVVFNLFSPVRVAAGQIKFRHFVYAAGVLRRDYRLSGCRDVVRSETFGRENESGRVAFTLCKFAAAYASNEINKASKYRTRFSGRAGQ